ncbi:MAG: hypothetical protein SNJ71_06720, partial [Bacteroidales bacterium]
MKNFNTIEDIFFQTLGKGSVKPPSSLWESIENQLNDESIEDLYKENFSKDEKTPPSIVWYNIHQQLKIAEFFRFSYKTVNIYTISTVGLIAGLLVFLGIQNTTQEIPVELQKKIEQENVIVHGTRNKNTHGNQQIQKDNNQVLKGFENNILQPNENTKPTTVQTAGLSSVSQTLLQKEKPNKATKQLLLKTNKQSNNPSIVLNLEIQGQNEACVNTEHIYTLKGLPDLNLFAYAWFYPLMRLYTLAPWNEGWSFA